MARQQKISARRLKRKVGTRQQVIIDEVGPTVAKGRSKADAPEIDGAVYLSSRRPLRVGEIVTAKIERADEYDLHGSVAGFEDLTPSGLWRRRTDLIAMIGRLNPTASKSTPRSSPGFPDRYAPSPHPSAHRRG